LDGGGEFAREMETDVVEALSDMISLVGLPERSSFAIDAILGWRDDWEFKGYVETADDGVMLLVGVSALVVGNAFEAFAVITFGRGVGPWATDTNGVLGGNAGNKEGARVGFGPFLTALLVSKIFTALDFFAGVADLGVTAVASASFPLPDSKAGNSSALRLT